MDKRSGSGLSAQIRGPVPENTATAYARTSHTEKLEDTRRRKVQPASRHILLQSGRKPFQREGFGNRNGFANAACAGRKAIQNKQLRK